MLRGTGDQVPNIDAQADVTRLFNDLMPERADEVRVLLDQISYQVANDRPSLHIAASAPFGHGLVVYTDRTMRQVWLITYAAWKTLHEQSGFIVGFLMQGRPYDMSAPDVGDAGRTAAESIARLSEALEKLRNAEPDEHNWPTEVPIITDDLRNLNGEEDQSAFELACFAAGFILLHESFHALERIAGRDYARVAEELASDRYAAEMLVSKMHEHALAKNYNIKQLGEKRAIGAFLGLVIILESTELGLTTPSDSHPAWTARVRDVLPTIEALNLDDDGHFWVFATSVLLSRLRREDVEIGRIDYDSARDLFFKALAHFDALGGA